MSLLFSASAAGHKMPSLAVVPRARRIEGLETEDSLIIYQKKGTFTTQNMIDHFVNRVMKPHLLRYQITKGE